MRTTGGRTIATTIFGPIWNRARADGGRSLGLFPLFAYGAIERNHQLSKYFGMPGVYWDKNELAGNSDLGAQAASGPGVQRQRV